jgi:uncharacterized protein
MDRLSYTEPMKQELAPKRVDVKAMALAGQQFEGVESLSNYERLTQDLRDLEPDSVLNWAAQFETRTGATGAAEPWLKLTLETQFPLVCQRCLGPVDLPVSLAREFRFVATEAIAEDQDDDSEEDLLVQARDFDLAGLIEDELVMALPLIPRHETCPTAVPMSAADLDFEASNEKPNPFAGLSGMLNGKHDGNSKS